MSFAATPVPDSMGADTIFVFNPATSSQLHGQAIEGKPLVFLWRYGEDMSIAERDAELGVGWILLLVFHVLRPGWQATGALGAKHGARMVSDATRLEYPKGAHLALDLEGLGDTGAPVLSYVRDCAAPVIAAGFKLCLYVGYSDGLLLAQLSQLVSEGTVDVLWSDYGPRVAPDGVGFVAKQQAQTKVAGIIVDPDRCYGHDARGRQLFGMALVAEIAPSPESNPPDPHVDPSGSVAA